MPFLISLSRIGSNFIFGAACLFATVAATPVRAADALDEFPPLAKQAHYKPAQLGPHEPQLEVDFPGGANSRGVGSGTATLSVSVDATGKVTEYFVVSYSDKAFGKALSDKATTLAYQPAKYKGVAVPGRLYLNYEFKYSGAVDVMEESRRKFGADDKLVYEPVTEDALDQHLEFTDLALPKVPVGYKVPADHPLRVYISFYIDETGHVHCPSVESAAAPELIAPAIKAVGFWTFRPPISKGKPVLVFARRPVVFVPRTPPATDASKPATTPAH